MPPAPQGGGQSDNSAGMLWGVAALFAAIGFVWFVFKNQLIVAYLTIKLHEAQFLSFLAQHFHYQADYFNSLYTTIFYARNTPAAMSFDDLMKLGGGVGSWFTWPLVILCLVLAVVVYLGSNTRIYKRLYAMRDLANLEKGNWPQISPVLNLELIKTDIDSGAWAMASSPMQFCKRHHLLEEVRLSRHEGMSRREWDKVEVVLKRGEANKIFALQLGAAWRGTASLPDHTKALFAVFAARINADSDVASKLLKQFNLSAGTKLDLTGCNEVIAKYENSKGVKAITERHAYIFTVMASMLEGARADGVQASADFLWLKPKDRKLWYTLNTVGRQTPFIEVGGIFAHWIAEKEAGRKLIVPMVEEATNALEIALKEIVYKRDEG